MMLKDCRQNHPPQTFNVKYTRHGTLKDLPLCLGTELPDVGVTRDISSTQPDEITAHVCANLRVIQC